jgi:murein DD-endopeptidase MepM/ murein hydrolase activator NlpD
LADLQPVDATTSFAHEDTEVLPLLRARDVVAEAPLQTAPALVREPGRRRATRADRSRTSLLQPVLHKVPSVPALLGVAVLAVSVGGVVSTADLEPASSTTRIGSLGALSGTDAIGAVGGRGEVLSRDSDRQALGDAAGMELEEQVEVAAEERNDALDQLAQQAEQHATILAENRWQLPLTSYRLTATFGEYGLWSSYHTGLDFAADTGTPIMAIARGVVTSTGYDGAYGNKTVITLEDGTELWFAHQTSMYVSVGEEVDAGDVIGSVGSTGNVTGPHLHLEVRPGGGDPVDPYAALVANGVSL